MRIQVHASLYDYLDALQREEEGQEVPEFIVTCGGRFTKRSPKEIRREMDKKTPKVTWEFLPSKVIETTGETVPEVA